MWTTLRLVTKTDEAWVEIMEADRGALYIFFCHLLPLVVLGLSFQAIVLYVKAEQAMGVLSHASFGAAGFAEFELVKLFSTILVIVGSTFLIKYESGGFFCRCTLKQSFVIVAYSLAPWYLLRVVDAFPLPNPWISYVVGITLSMALLYHGIPKVIDPLPSQTFGFFLAAAVVLIGITMVEHFAMLSLAKHLGYHLTATGFSPALPVQYSGALPR